MEMDSLNPAEMGVANKLRDLRLAAGWSQERMARRMSDLGHPWHPQTVGRIEQYERQVRIGELVDLAAIFGIAPEAFLGDLDVPSTAAARPMTEQELRDRIADEIAGRAA